MNKQELKPFDDRLAALLASLSPAGRRKLAAKMAKALRAGQQQRIRRQQAPDGTPYAPRKTQPLRGKKGRVKREMFGKLRTAKYLKTTGGVQTAVVSFAGRVQNMARVHQFGLRDRPTRYSADVRYPERPLLGFSATDIEIMDALLIVHLSQ